MTTTDTRLTASYFSSTALNATASASASLLQRTAYNKINATASTAVNIGNLVTNQTQLTTYGEVTGSNPTDYYTFNLTGNSIKGYFSNTTNTTDLRFQITDSKGNVIADNQGSAEQQAAYNQMNSASGLTATAGQYTVKVTYAPISTKSLSQNYGFQLYSGTRFNTSYETTAKTQNKSTTYVPTDNTQVWADSDAKSYTAQQYNQINAKASTAVNIGWLSPNKTALGLNSQLTPADNVDYYSYTVQQDGSTKMAFNNTTNTSALRVQIYDSTGTQLIADSQGTAAQKATYAKLTSSTGLSQKAGSYVVEVSYAQGASKSKAQTYNFQLYSGNSYTSLDTTTASAQTIENAILSGSYTPAYSSAVAAANYVSGNTSTDIFSALSLFA